MRLMTQITKELSFEESVSLANEIFYKTQIKTNSNTGNFSLVNQLMKLRDAQIKAQGDIREKIEELR